MPRSQEDLDESADSIDEEMIRIRVIADRLRASNSAKDREDAKTLDDIAENLSEEAEGLRGEENDD